MNIIRQYNSSNCTLVLEGLSTDEPSIMSILLNAECRLVSSRQSLSGGKTFFENLATAVNAYTQEFLSGLRHPHAINPESDIIYLEPVNYHHRLTWQKSKDNDQDKQEIELTTMQLFDLMETIDQFLTDKSTLPDFSLVLQPVSRRYRKVEEPIVERSLPAIVGIGSVVLTAIAFFFMEPPKVREPKPQPLDTSTETIPTPPNSPQTESSPSPTQR